MTHLKVIHLFIWKIKHIFSKIIYKGIFLDMIFVREFTREYWEVYMKKKILIWIGCAIGLVGLTAGITYGMLELADNPADKQASAEIDTSEYKTVPKEKEAQFGEIGGASAKLQITKDSTEEDLVKAMHSMTHQKVIAEQKWGAIPMSKENAEKVRSILNESNFETKEELLAIAERWINKDFSKVVDDHNYFWKLQGGNIGKATGVMDPLEEQTFSLNNFGDGVTGELHKSGDLQ